MDLRPLYHFRTVAEEMNFGRAAERLGIAQPQLSVSIKKLEATLQNTLFDRSRRQIALTAAGEILLAESAEILNRVALMRRLVERSGNHGARQLRLGCSIPSLLFGIVPSALARFRRIHSDVEVTVEDVPATDMAAALLDGRIDLGLSLKGDIADPKLASRSFYKASVYAAIPSDWPLAQRQSLSLSEMADLPFILGSQGLRPHYDAMVIAACREAGFTPNVARYAAPHAIFAFVAAGIGVSLANSLHVLTLPARGVHYCPITDAPDYLHVDFAMAWMPRAVPAQLSALIRVVETLDVGAPDAG
jgi:DNA-binding transcriptional LysR family regulator